jgi:type IV pilus assembly protein PilB
VQGVPAGSVFDEGGPRETTEPPPPPPPEVDLAHIYIDDAVLDLLPTWLVRQHLVIPVRLEGDVLLVAMLDPGNEKALAAMKEHTGLDIRGLRADEEALLMRYTMHYRL